MLWLVLIKPVNWRLFASLYKKCRCLQSICCLSRLQALTVQMYLSFLCIHFEVLRGLLVAFFPLKRLWEVKPLSGNASSLLICRTLVSGRFMCCHWEGLNTTIASSIEKNLIFFGVDKDLEELRQLAFSFVSYGNKGYEISTLSSLITFLICWVVLSYFGSMFPLICWIFLCIDIKVVFGGKSCSLSSALVQNITKSTWHSH